LQDAAIVKGDVALEGEPVALFAQGQAQLAHARTRADAHALAFGPDALDAGRVEGLQFAYQRQGRAVFERVVEGGAFAFEVALDLYRATPLFAQHMRRAVAGFEPAAIGLRPDQKLQA